MPTADFNPRQPFRRTDALTAGVSVRALTSPAYLKIGHDSYVASSVSLTLAVRAQAALASCPPGSYASHHMAAVLWGADVPRSADVHVSVLDAAARRRRRGIQAHLGRAGCPTRVIRGVRVSSPAQTFLDLAASGLTLVDLVVAGDGLVRRGRTSPEELVAATDAWHGRGSRLARRAASLVRGGVDSAMQTRLRLLIVFAGLPEPRVNWVLRDEDGEPWRRFDLYYEQWRLLVEYDGRQHAEDSDQWHSDIARREELDPRDCRLLIVTSRGIYREPLRTLERIRTTLVERGATGLPRSFNDEWRRHFPPP